MKDLYHGTIADIDKIELSKGKGYKDFGKGFYASAVKNHADSIAKRNKHSAEIKENNLSRRIPKYKMKTYHAYRYNLEFDDSCIENPCDLKIKIFNQADREWVRFVLDNRFSENSNHDYDIVIGPTADENTVTILNAYKEELIRTNYADEVLDELIKELEPENLPKQYFFRTEKSLEKLRFKKNRRETVE